MHHGNGKCHAYIDGDSHASGDGASSSREPATSGSSAPATAIRRGEKPGRRHQFRATPWPGLLNEAAATSASSATKAWAK